MYKILCISLILLSASIRATTDTGMVDLAAAVVVPVKNPAASPVGKFYLVFQQFRHCHSLT